MDCRKRSHLCIKSNETIKRKIEMNLHEIVLMLYDHLNLLTLLMTSSKP